MNWLHTWAGLALGAILFAIFWMGTLSVFDREIDRWMMPDTRLATNAPPAWPALIDSARALAPDSPSWGFVMPSPARADSALLLPRRRWQLRFSRPRPRRRRRATRGRHPGRHGLYLPVSLPPAPALLGPSATGWWGWPAMAMLVLLVSGVIIHRKIFAEFFTLSPPAQTAARQPRPAQSDRRAGPAVSLCHGALGPHHFLRHLLPRRHQRALRTMTAPPSTARSLAAFSARRRARPARLAR